MKNSQVPMAGLFSVLLAACMILFGGSVLAGKMGEGKGGGKKGKVADTDDYGEHGKHKGKDKDKDKGPGEDGNTFGKHKGPGEHNGPGEEGNAFGKHEGPGKHQGPGEGGNAFGKHKEAGLDGTFGKKKKFDPKVKEKLSKSAKAKKGPKVKEKHKHLKRMAKLRRLHSIAAKKGDETLAERVNKLMLKERNRHLKALKKHNK